VWSMIGRRMGPTPLDSDDAWESMQDRIAEHERHERFSLPGRGLEHLRIEDGGLAGAHSRTFTPTRILVGTAAIIAIGTATIVAWQLRDESKPLITYSAPRGEAPVERGLSDGSHVVLAPDSRLQFVVDRHGNRRASLVGEAIFNVVHDPRHDFAVSAPGLETHDIGTEFDVRDYQGSARSVAVRSGRVSVKAGKGAAAIIGGGYAGKVDPVTGNLLITGVSDTYFDWTNGQLVFRDTPLREVVSDIGRRYNLDFETNDSALAALPVTITVPDGTAESTLDLLRATVTKLQYARDGQKVRLFRQ
jgi:transmembrane sensor